MQTTFSRIASNLRQLPARVGHDLIWIIIAGLFCIVEVAVLVTQYAPGKRVAPLAHTRTPAESPRAVPQRVFAG